MRVAFSPNIYLGVPKVKIRADWRSEVSHHQAASIKTDAYECLIQGGGTGRHLSVINQPTAGLPEMACRIFDVSDC
jgi:hypothetical protein